MLDFAKIEAGGLTLEETDFHLDTVLDSVTNVTAMRAEEKGLEMIYAVAEDVPRFLRGDPLRLGQVLINLLSNAVKFTDRGEVLVTISNTAQSPGRVSLMFSVKDTGIGLEPGQIDGLFRAFTQLGRISRASTAAPAWALPSPASSLNSWAARSGRKVNPGPAGTFHFTIDVELPRESQGATLSAMRHAPLPQRALIADDNALSREILADLLRSLGIQPTTVDSGAAALGRIRGSGAGRSGLRAGADGLADAGTRRPGDPSRIWRAQSAATRIAGGSCDGHGVRPRGNLSEQRTARRCRRTHQASDPLDDVQHAQQDLQRGSPA